jgi:hypothetical protein
MFTRDIIDSIKEAVAKNPHVQEVRVWGGVAVVLEENEALIKAYLADKWVDHGTITVDNQRYTIFIG